ncbi:MAG: hypothetical protein AAF714_00245 [Pseudomonadota bacterium]
MLRIELGAAVSVVAGTGEPVVLRSRRGLALLAVLATADRHERSRASIQAMLWPRSEEAQAQGSLRTLLSALRTALGADGDALRSDAGMLSLDGVTVTRRSDEASEFFENAPALGEAFEDWLTLERSRARSAPGVEAAAPRHGCDRHAQRLRVVLLPPITRGDGIAEELAAARLSNAVVDRLHVHDGGIEILDTSFGMPFDLADCATDAAFQLSVQSVDGVAFASARVFDASTNAVLWSGTAEADIGGIGPRASANLECFANRVSDALIVALLRLADGRDGRARTLVGAMHQILSMSTEAQTRARETLRHHLNRATAAAWYAFSLAHTFGEVGEGAAIYEEAEAQVRRAVELDPTNAMVLALAGHVEGFLLRRRDYGATLLRSAVRIAPSSAMVWDLSAMNALYCGDTRTALIHGHRAVRFGRHSPYAALYASSLSIAAAAHGRHSLAIRSGQMVLTRLPGFLAVERHLFGSLATTGRVEEARAVARRIRKRDARFRPSHLDDPSYTLPSQDSVALIRSGFERAGLSA